MKLKVHFKGKPYAFIFLFLLGLFVLLLQSPILLFSFAVLLFILILATAKISFFTEISFILTFSYMQGVIHQVIGIGGSTLAWAGEKIPFYFTELSVATISFMLTMLWFVWFTKLIRHEKQLYLKGSGIKLGTGILFILIAFILILLIFPSLPTVSFGESTRARNESLSGLYGLVLTALLLCSLTIDLSFQYKLFTVSYFLICFWILGHGERVEVLGFLSYYGLKLMHYYNFSNIKKSIARHKKKLIYIGGVVILFLAMWIGMARSGYYSSISLKMILYNLVVQPTCGDIVYVFNCAADMWHTGNGLYGYTYLQYLTELIPGATDQFSPAVILLDKYETMGGGLFFSEPMMNFGIIGVVLMNIEFCITMNLILKKISHFRSWFWVPIVIEVFRIAWYGRAGWILCAFVEVPLLFLATRLVLNKIRIK